MQPIHISAMLFTVFTTTSHASPAPPTLDNSINFQNITNTTHRSKCENIDHLTDREVPTTITSNRRVPNAGPAHWEGPVHEYINNDMNEIRSKKYNQYDLCIEKAGDCQQMHCHYGSTI
jgi:hypothetical protein